MFPATAATSDDVRPRAHSSLVWRPLALLRRRLDDDEHPFAPLLRHRWAGYQLWSYALPSRETTRGGGWAPGVPWPLVLAARTVRLRLKLQAVVALRVGHRLCISVARDARSQLNFRRDQRNCITSYLLGWRYEPSRTLIVHVRS